MADPRLYGNGTACPACALRRAAMAPFGPELPVPCNACGGIGRIAESDLAIIAAACAWAAAHYWPQFDRRNQP